MWCLGWELVGLHGKRRLGRVVFTCYVPRLALPQPLLQDWSAHHGFEGCQERSFRVQSLGFRAGESRVSGSEQSVHVLYIEEPLCQDQKSPPWPVLGPSVNSGVAGFEA